MVLSRLFEGPDLLVATLTDSMTARDQDLLVEWVRTMIRAVGHVRVLVRLHRFAGWVSDESFCSPTLWLQDDEGVSKIAIVGPRKWKQPMLTFIAQPLRRIPIAYFETEPAARRWLGLGEADLGDMADAVRH